mmetsp:Transcript_13999/g.27935  ORF Transcript_13999/g.27935 Transcript_13999/m.27935 type:complete len:147 (-) Transcript_13999:117-557(-)
MQSALGVATKDVVVALGSGQVATLERRFLDPRRPSAEVRKAEEKEGLFQYNPALPISPMAVLSYHLQVEGATGVISAGTRLESQGVVAAYGGPDLFVTRVSPARGFDLLPEGFQKKVLVVVVGAIWTAFLVLREKSKWILLKGAWA